MKDTMEKLRWAYTHFTPEFNEVVFGDRDNYAKLFCQYLTDKRIQCTPTVMTGSIDTIFANRNICGAILRQNGDKRPEIENDDFRTLTNVAMYLTPDIFDVDTLIQFVNKNSFNSVIVDSVRVAASMAYQTKGVTYIIGTWRWNFTKNGTFMGIEHLNLSEVANKNEFGIFHPYNFKTQITNNREDPENGNNNNSSDSV